MEKKTIVKRKKAKRGRPTIGAKAMNSNERMRRSRQKIEDAGGIEGAFVLRDPKDVAKFEKLQEQLGMSRKNTAEYLICQGLRLEK